MMEINRKFEYLRKNNSPLESDWQTWSHKVIF